MRSLLKYLLVILVLPVTAPADDLFLSPGRNQYRGFALVDRIVSERLIREGSGFSLGSYLTGGDDRNSSILLLLGGFASMGTTRQFQNGHPHSLNLTLYQILFSQFAQDLAKTCHTPEAVPLRAEVREVMARVCRWPHDDARTEAVLLGFWLALMSYDAPMEEFLAWKTFLETEYAAAPAEEAVTAMALTIFMNPHFLLNQ